MVVKDASDAMTLDRRSEVPPARVWSYPGGNESHVEEARG